MATALLNVNVHGKVVKDRQICLELLIALYLVCRHANIHCAEASLQYSCMPCCAQVVAGILRVVCKMYSAGKGVRLLALIYAGATCQSPKFAGM